MNTIPVTLKTYQLITGFIIIFGLSLFQHFSHLNKELISIHVWRQTQTQSTINNFYEEDYSILNPKRNDRGNGDGIFRMEFPLMQWVNASLYKLFGNHLIITRIFMLITGFLSVIGIYLLLNELFNHQILALTGAWAFNFSPSFYYHTINPLPDNFALCVSIWGIFFFFNWLRNKNTFTLIGSGFLLSIGALCKLPFILYFSVPAFYFISEIYKNGIFTKNTFKAAAILGFSVLPIAWYYTVVPHWEGNGIVKGIFNNTTPFLTILDYFQHHLISTLPELLLNYGSVLFFLAGFYYLIRNKAYTNSYFTLIFIWSISILSYFIFEINMIEKVHDYYLFPFLPLVFILVSYGAIHLLNSLNSVIKWGALTLLLTLPFFAYLRMKGRWNIESPNFNKDLLTYKAELRSAIPNNSLVVAGNDESHFIFFYYIDKKGWGFHNNELNAEQLSSMIKNGAEYLYTDSRDLDNKEEIKPFLHKLILEKGSVKVYQLRLN